MNIIMNFEELPYPIKLVKEIAEIRFKENVDNALKVSEAIIMCNLIRGIIELNDHYILMNDSVEFYERILSYDIEVKLNLIDFKERKKNRRRKYDLGLIDTPLYTMESWYCSPEMYNIMSRVKI